MAGRGRGRRRDAAKATAGAPSAEAIVADVLAALPDAGFLLDPHGTILIANAAANRQFPLARAGTAFTMTFRWPGVAEALEQARAGEAQRLEVSEPGSQGRAYAASFGPLNAAEGTQRFILAAFDDISDRQALARMRSDFVANASHEMRTPLASLTGFIETLLGPAKGDAAATEKFLGIMLDQARRMRLLLDDLLSLSRLEMRAHQRPEGDVDLAAVLKHVRDALSPLAAEHKVAVTMELPAERLDVTGDRDELVQVFQNLVENAIRYGGSGGTVEISAELPAAPAGRVAVHVQDHGPGIGEEHLPRLTERFYRVDVGTSRAMKGTGLGLAIVKHILTRHSGRLQIQSELGKGARFSVILPLAPTAAVAKTNS